MPMPREKLLGRVIEKMLLLLIHIGNAALGLVGEHGAASARVEGTTVRRNRPGYMPRENRLGRVMVRFLRCKQKQHHAAQPRFVRRSHGRVLSPAPCCLPPKQRQQDSPQLLIVLARHLQVPSFAYHIRGGFTAEVCCHTINYRSNSKSWSTARKESIASIQVGGVCLHIK